ncbi:MAG: sodium:proton antiporter [Planctomycetaceae bacterium]|jgi:Na+/H+ antiporter NhaD/arsenite permease-like protein|nr:sodium:proton antiporter [Planctomycetaceae bacterium]
MTEDQINGTSPAADTEIHKEHNEEPQPTKRTGIVAAAIIILLLGYGFLAHKGLPQHWTEIANVPHHAEQHEHSTEQTPAPNAVHAPPVWTVLPFAALLLCIAILPLVPAAAHFWESNGNKFYVASALSVLTLLYYGFVCNFPVDLHFPAHKIIEPAAGGLEIAKTVFINAIVNEYVPFIVLLFALFTITGGIRISGDLKATPFVNSVILLIGAALASIIGTTGAAVLLIRLLLETNKERKYKVHTVVIFIFAVCNCGGCLTPLGDPPLFLGYLRGVAFEWTVLNLYPAWLFVNLILIGFYFLWDTLWFYRREPAENKALDNANAAAGTGFSIQGWQLNVPLLVGVVAAVAMLDPAKPVPGTSWHPWYFLREAVQLLLCALSLLGTSKMIRKQNTFNFLAIGEVAALFFGIFITMQAPLQILNAEGKDLVAKIEKNTGIEKTKLFFWSTGALSSVLDNAPTYVVFFETAKALTPNSESELTESGEWEKDDKGVWRATGAHHDQLVPVSDGFLQLHLLIAVALGAVFCGAMTYIGNGPNFMVKAIAEQSGVKMPSFFGYMAYSFLILLPILFVMTLLFV